ncbi:MAG: spore cortex biosynthesis protein YabQ [Clostridia bacterium]|nr:spore cortex biosynthesis protein YabQ [Clostridia bacterium]
MTMGFHNAEQIRELFLSGGMGFLLGAYYDVFRVLRCLLKPGALRVFWQDIVFCVTSAGWVFLFALAVTDGILRVYLFAGLLAGFLAYRYTVGQIVVRTVTSFCQLVAKGMARIRQKASAVAQKVQKKMKKLKKGIATGIDCGV